jgi:hypothetical protein
VKAVPGGSPRTTSATTCAPHTLTGHLRDRDRRQGRRTVIAMTTGDDRTLESLVVPAISAGL